MGLYTTVPLVLWGQVGLYRNVPLVLWGQVGFYRNMPQVLWGQVDSMQLSPITTCSVEQILFRIPKDMCISNVLATKSFVWVAKDISNFISPCECWTCRGHSRCWPGSTSCSTSSLPDSPHSWPSPRHPVPRTWRRNIWLTFLPILTYLAHNKYCQNFQFLSSKQEEAVTLSVSLRRCYQPKQLVHVRCIILTLIPIRAFIILTHLHHNIQLSPVVFTLHLVLL